MQTVKLQSTEYHFEEKRKMNGVKRVIVFCILIVILPATLIITPLYLRKTIFADVTYPVAESDIIEIRDGISSIFCQQHSLHMNSKFNAFQLRSKPEISTNHKHIRLKKSMTLPDDTLEYWGFYLLKGARVHLKFCSRYDGSRILVVKGQRDLRTCGLLDHNKNKMNANLAQGHEQVKVFFEDMLEIAPDHLEMNGKNSTTEGLQKTEDHNKDSVDGGVLEAENHGGEDLDEDDYYTDTESLRSHVGRSTADISPAMNNNSLSSTTASPSSTTNRNARRYRKKLKKGTPNSVRPSQQQQSQQKSQQEKQSTESGEHIEGKGKDATLANTLKDSKETSQQTAANHSAETTNNRRRRHHQSNEIKKSNNESEIPSQDAEEAAYLQRHATEHALRKQKVYDQLYKKRSKRNEHVYDRKYSHGGNAVNFTETDESNSISSFEDGLFQCFNGAILLAEGFPPSPDCLNTHFLENGSHRMLSKHEITEDGYYYYIFYSDNDLVRNDIHAIFDIYKPTFQYSNSQGCVNATNCTFPIGFMSDEIVVVEVPTRDGIEHEEDDITYLISTCHPRTEVYAIFPITVLILILACSFL